MGTKADRLSVIHREAMARFDKTYSAQQDEREQCVQDRRFYSIPGAQWEGGLGEQFANKPRLEVNKIHLSVIRIFNEYRNNRVTVDYMPRSATSDKLADTCDGLFRADEDASNALEAYDNAFEEAVGGGFGAFRLRAEYEDDEDPDNDRQKIFIEPIFDADTSVFFDVDAKRQDKRDAKYCYVLNSMTPEEYKDTYGKPANSFPKPINNSFDWSSTELVYVAEYYRVEQKRMLKVVMARIDGTEEPIYPADTEEAEEKIQGILDAGGRELSRRYYKADRVHKYLLDGGGVVEDCGMVAGKWIPIIPVYGKRWYVDGVERCMGHVRLCKDVQRLINMQLSKLAEISAVSSVSKPIFTPDQIAGHEAMWSVDNLKNYPYLLINPTTDLDGNPIPTGPVAFTQSPQIPPAMAALLSITQQDMRDLLGNNQAGEEMKANISGKVVELIQNRLDMQSYIYMDNFAKAMRRAGEIWLSMARELYVESNRVMRVINPDETVGFVELQKEEMEGDEYGYSLDISKAAYDVKVDVGPSSSSRRASTVRSLMAMMAITTDPETTNVLGSMAMMNMEGEGISEVRSHFRRKLIRMGVVKPTDEEARELAAEAEAQKPDANTMYLEAAAKNETAKAVKAEADTLLTLAKTAQARADTMKTMNDVDSQNQADLISGAKALQEAAAALNPGEQPVTPPLG